MLVVDSQQFWHAPVWRASLHANCCGPLMSGSDAGAYRQAVVLVGGEGTRLRPITSLVPKPAVPLMGRPFISYILENLARHGVRRVVFSTGHLAAAMEAEMGNENRLRAGSALRLRGRAPRHRRRDQERRLGARPRRLSTSSTATCSATWTLRPSSASIARKVAPARFWRPRSPTRAGTASCRCRPAASSPVSSRNPRAIRPARPHQRGRLRP